MVPTQPIYLRGNDRRNATGWFIRSFSVVGPTSAWIENIDSQCCATTDRESVQRFRPRAFLVLRHGPPRQDRPAVWARPVRQDPPVQLDRRAPFEPDGRAAASTTSCAAARAVRATRGAPSSPVAEDDLMRIFGSERMDAMLRGSASRRTKRSSIPGSTRRWRRRSRRSRRATSTSARTSSSSTT